MITNNPIRSILDATNEQFTPLYERCKNPKYSLDEYLIDQQIRQGIARKDAENLREIGVIPGQISEKFSRIIDKANAIFHERITKEPRSPISSNYSQPIDVEDEGLLFRVTGFDLRKQMVEGCALCEHIIGGPATYLIENMRTQEKIKVPELTLHLMTHDYFSKPGEYRVDPIVASRVTQLAKK